MGSDREDDVEDHRRARIRDLVAFWILGLCNNYPYVIMLSAGSHILEDKSQAGMPLRITLFIFQF